MRYFVAFGQFFEARDKQEAEDKAIQAMWGSLSVVQPPFGISIEECPEPETDPTTGVKHWPGADQ